MTECSTSTSTTTITLLADCTETSPFTVPSGFTFDGAGFTLTAADPSSSVAFVGAAVQNTTGGPMDVANLKIVGASTVLDCSPFTGIQFLDAGGSVTNTTIDNLLRGGYTGCQNGLGIRVDNTTTTSQALTIDRTTVTRYNKNGITVSGPVAATITNNTVTGAGPLDLGFAAQNGIQISFGATAKLVDNNVSGNNYTPAKVTACGLLLYKAGGVSGASKSGITFIKASVTKVRADVSVGGLRERRGQFLDWPLLLSVRHLRTGRVARSRAPRSPQPGGRSGGFPG